MRSHLLSKLELLFNVIRKTSFVGIADKFRMDATYTLRLIGSSIKVNRISEVLLNGHFLNLLNTSLVSYKTCKNIKQFQPGILQGLPPASY